VTIQNKEHVLGGPYKAWYHKQPKLLKIVIIPFTIAISLIIIKTQNYSLWWLVVPAALLFISFYNQYLDTILNEDLDKLLDKSKSKVQVWRSQFERLVYLNNVLNELVESKSEMFLETATLAIDDSPRKGIEQIREAGSYKNSLDRIIALIYKVFERYTDIERKQEFRVCYLVPDTESDTLIAKSWYNKDKIPPFSVSKPNPAFFKKGDSTVAGHLWARNSSPSLLIDDIEKFKQDSKNASMFEYTNSGQSDYLKSIYCYKVMNKHECIGILCIDSNISGTLEKYEQFYKDVLESFAKRIVFETRCAYMKNTLSREE